MNVQIQPSNIELEGYYVRELEFSVQPEGSDETNKILLTRGFHVQLEKPIEIGEYQINIAITAAEHESDTTRYRLALSLSSMASPEYQTPYKFKVTLVGFFRLIGLTISQPIQEPAVVQSSVAILYAAAREVLAAATARGPFPALILPVMKISVLPSKAKTTGPSIAKNRPTKKMARKK